MFPVFYPLSVYFFDDLSILLSFSSASHNFPSCPISYRNLSTFPIEKGLLEAAASFSLAIKLKPAAVILDDATEQITYTYNNRSVALTVPTIIFG